MAEQNKTKPAGGRRMAAILAAARRPGAAARQTRKPAQPHIVWNIMKPVWQLYIITGAMARTPIANGPNATLCQRCPKAAAESGAAAGGKKGIITGAAKPAANGGA